MTRRSIDVTVKLAIVMFPYLMCMSLTAMLSGMLNSLQHYFAAAVAPIFLNIAHDRRAWLRPLDRRRSPGNGLVSLLGRARGRRPCRWSCSISACAQPA